MTCGMGVRKKIEWVRDHVPRRGERAWAYGYSDIARLLGIQEQTVRKKVSDGKLDPSNLEGLFRAWLHAHALGKPGK